MVILGVVLRRLLPPGDGMVLIACLQCVFNQHHVFVLPPGVQTLFDAPTDCLGCGDMMGSLQDHCMKDNEPLQVLLSVPYPLQLPPQRLDKPTPDFTTRGVIATQWHDREVTPPCLPRRVVADASVQMRARIGMNPVSVDLLET